jgi:large subunit ribosomal protein L25
MEVPVKIVESKGVMAGGFTFEHHVIKKRALLKNLPDFVEADIYPLDMGNKLYVTKVPAENFKIMHPDNTVIAQVRFLVQL